MITFKIGIIGAGNIAHTVADTITKLEGFDIAAVAARDLDRAKEFAAEFNIPTAYGSYDELLHDDKVELVYISTVNSTHFELAKACIEAGKPCLVEKPFTCNFNTAKELIDLSIEKKVFCGEAMWTSFTPMMMIAKDAIEKKVIGDVRMITANFGVDLKGVDRITNPELGGGVLLDLGIYPINAVFKLMGGIPLSLASSCVKVDTGVDIMDTVSMNYPNGRLATIMATGTYNSDNKCIIYGTLGRLEMDNVNNPQKIELYNNKNEVVQTINVPDKQISGYEYEFIEARRAVITGKLQCFQHTFDDILNFMATADLLKVSWKATLPLPGEATEADIKERMEMQRRNFEAMQRKKAEEKNNQ